MFVSSVNPTRVTMLVFMLEKMNFITIRYSCSGIVVGVFCLLWASSWGLRVTLGQDICKVFGACWDPGGPCACGGWGVAEGDNYHFIEEHKCV